ncbi:MAG: hypothetical protein ACFFCO_04285, partial [Promethearchaeota archaeon]
MSPRFSEIRDDSDEEEDIRHEARERKEGKEVEESPLLKEYSEKALAKYREVVRDLRENSPTSEEQQEIDEIIE